jgi:adenine-specific DNA-methyltransferase
MGDRPNLIFPITAPDGSKVNPKRQWLWSKERVEKALEKNER